MSRKTTAQKLARALQRVAEDEFGARPKLTTCHNIVRDHAHVLVGTVEEKAARLYVDHEAQLRESAKVREGRE